MMSDIIITSYILFAFGYSFGYVYSLEHKKKDENWIPFIVVFYTILFPMFLGMNIGEMFVNKEEKG